MFATGGHNFIVEYTAYITVGDTASDSHSCQKVLRFSMSLNCHQYAEWLHNVITSSSLTYMHHLVQQNANFITAS